MSPPCKPRYRTTNWKQYNAALKARGSGLVGGLGGHAHGMVRRCQRQTPAEPEVLGCSYSMLLTLKNLFALALRQTTGLVESVLQLCGLAWPAPDFSTLCRRQRDLDVQIPYTRSKAGLHLLVDSTGIKCLGEDEWKGVVAQMPGEQLVSFWHESHSS